MSKNPQWRLGCQAYTFRLFTLFEAIDKVASLGLKYIEGFPTKKLTPDDPEARFVHHAPRDVWDATKAKLTASGVTMSSYGMIGFTNDEAQCRSVFEFVKDMGIGIIMAEPALDALPLVDSLCQEYDVKVALHNHPNPSKYWSPDIVLDACKGRSDYVGVCADTGHWMRSGLNPLDCLRKLEGRVISLHLKDLERYGEGAHDVPWGSGEGNVPALLDEIRRQGADPLFLIEYEYNWENSLPDVAECVKLFRQHTAAWNE